jgi:hypothetical protein
VLSSPPYLEVCWITHNLALGCQQEFLHRSSESLDS